MPAVYCVSKPKTSKIITAVKCGRLPASTAWYISALYFMNWLHHTSDDKLQSECIVNWKIITFNGLQLGQQMLWSWQMAIPKMKKKTFTNNWKHVVVSLNRYLQAHSGDTGKFPSKLTACISIVPTLCSKMYYVHICTCLWIFILYRSMLWVRVSCLCIHASLRAHAFT